MLYGCLFCSTCTFPQMRSYLHCLSFPVQHACVVNALFILLFMQRFTDAASLFQHRLRRRLSHSHWRGNKYIARDGILPYQRCGVNNTVAHADPLYAEYQIGQASYSLIVLAASVWGQSRSAGKAPLVDAVEFLAFDTLSKRACALDTGNHCMTFMNATHAQLLGEIRCEFDLGESAFARCTSNPAASPIPPPPGVVNCCRQFEPDRQVRTHCRSRLFGMPERHFTGWREGAMRNNKKGGHQ